MFRIRLINILVLFVSIIYGQDEKPKYHNIGVNYYGEFGFKPGLEIDYALSLFTKGQAKDKKKRFLQQQLNIRPALAYYHYAKNSNNYSLSVKCNYQLSFVNSENAKYFYIEPFVKIGYLRKSYIGDIYKTTSQGFEKINNAGTNSLIVGGGLDFGGYISQRMDWLVGMDYFIENTEDQLILHRFVAKAGIRLKLQKK